MAKPIWSLDDINDNLTRSNNEWAGDSVTFSFMTSLPTGLPSWGPTGFQAFSAAQEAATREVMQLYDDIIDIDIIDGGNSNSGDIRLGQANNVPGNTAWGGSPGSGAGGDVWFDTGDGGGDDTNIGEWGYSTRFLHEIGHALGLSHPGAYNVTDDENPTYEDDAEYSQDSNEYTVMSYFNAAATGADHSPPGEGTSYAATPLLHDISALQSIYGANMSTRTGNTTYGFNSNAGRDAFDFTINDAPVVAIWDAGGIDTLDLSGFSEDAHIELSEGGFSDAGGMTDNIAIAYGAVIENAVGGSGDDDIHGNGADNVLKGAGGDDSIYGYDGDDTLAGGADDDFLKGGGGADELNGGTGIDTASYVGSSAGVWVDLAGNQGLYGDAQGDTFTSIENVQGSSHNDYIFGTDEANVLDGEDGDDLLKGAGGADEINGGAGNDTASYENSSAGVTVTTTAGSGGDAEGDVLTSIENLTGSAHADTLIGDNGANTLNGLAGNDVLKGAGGGDTLNGGSGSDTASYITSAAGVTVDLEGDTASGGDAAGDELNSIENLIGSNHNDGLIGNAGVNQLDGEGGDDTLKGGGGADVLNGGAGNDTISYATSDAAVWVDIDANTGTGGDAEGDTMSSIENVFGSAHDDILTGNDQVNDLSGGNGDDLLKGAGGADEINGGNGSDTASYATSAEGVVVSTTGGSGGDADGDVLTSIENLTGSNHDDTLIGDGNANVLSGLNGNDVLKGAGGADEINGGGGNDTASYITSATGVVVSTTGGSAGDADGDVLTSIENLTGSSHDDTLIGDGNANVLEGLNGNDILKGAGGADTLDGGAGNDTAHYSDSSEGVTVRLWNGTGLGGSAEGDTLSEIENVVGSSEADLLAGDSAANVLNGAAGADTLNGGGGDDTLIGGGADDVLMGGAGADDLNGGTGTDRAEYLASAAGVTVRLWNGTGLGGDAEGDTLTDIEDVTGSSSADMLAGNSAANVLNGHAGADTLNGGGGGDTLIGGGANDVLNGGTGADTLNGGNGNDTAEYDDSASGVTVRLWNGTGLGGDAEGDTLVNIENVTGSAFADLLAGNSSANVLNGLAGADTLNGGGGGDTLNGGIGNDVLDGGAGADTLNGGGGTDAADYGDSAAGVTVRLWNGTGLGGDAEGDTLTDIENVYGSTSGDLLAGDSGANVLRGRGGSDVINSGGGNDTVFGGGGNDTFVFADNSGDNTVMDFSSNDAEDIDLSGVTSINSFGDLVNNHLNNNGGTAEIVDGANSILLQGVNFADVGVGELYSADDFIF